MMNNYPLPTIGISVCNCERFIKQAVMSVLKQTHTNLGLIITDDGSTDNSVEKIKNQGFSYWTFC